MKLEYAMAMHAIQAYKHLYSNFESLKCIRRNADRLVANSTCGMRFSSEISKPMESLQDSMKHNLRDLYFDLDNLVPVVKEPRFLEEFKELEYAY